MRSRAPLASFGVLVLVFASGNGITAQSPSPAVSAAPVKISELAATGENSSQDAANELSLAVGKSVLIDFAHPVMRVAVGIGDFAEASAITPNEIMVSGKAAGETSMIVWDMQGGRQFFNVVVRPNEAAANKLLEGVRRELRAELPGQGIKATEENGTIFLRGAVKDLNASDRAQQIARSAGKVVNLLNVEVPTADPQILLKVRFASVDRSKERDFAANFVSAGAGNTAGVVSTGQFSPPTVATDSSGAITTTFSSGLNLMAFPIGAANIGASIKALETKGLVEVLAEPNLLAANGKQASFLAGGEYPYPIVQGTGAGTSVTIMFKEYGVRLNFIPTITPRNTIKLQVAPEVSSLDFTNAVTISGFTVPAIATRKVNTQVELADGQSFVVGGLLDNRETETFEKIPFLGDIPILGKFFQSISRNRTNSELIVIVTPEIVSPIAAGAQLPELNYPQKFLKPNSETQTHNPDAKTADNTIKPAPKTMPVEKLVESIKSEKPLVIEGATGGFGGASSPGSSSGASGSGTPTVTSGP